jgi:hypothetical protein
MTQKMKVNFYLDHPKHSYYEVILNSHKDCPSSLMASIFQKLYPPHLHSYSTLDPAFFHVQTGTVLDPYKTFAENGISTTTATTNNDADMIPDVRVRLKINVLPLSQLP